MRPEEKAAQLLQKQKKTLSIAESCTGGLLSNRLTNIPGSTKYFQLGIISYSNESKMRLLKVPKQYLIKYGAVSPQVAECMAKNVRKIQKTDFGIGITGIAGPAGGTKQKPVGLTYIAVSTPSKITCTKNFFKGSRTQIKTRAVNKALQLLLQIMYV